MIAVGLVSVSVQSVIRAWRSSPQAPISNSMPVDQEQPLPAPAVSAPAEVQSSSAPHDFVSEAEAARQKEEAERAIMQRRAKETQENPAAGSIANDQLVR